MQRGRQKPPFVPTPKQIADGAAATRAGWDERVCSEHRPTRQALTLHGAACHACLFVPETSCERGNKYLDRSVLVKTMERDDLAFFEP